LYDAVRFLIDGESPVQTGVAPGTIQTQRAAVLRGRVLDSSGQPLPGVDIRILGHPELGSTASRAQTGEFDMLVNGGGKLTLIFQAAGYITVHRSVEAPWEDYLVLDDVAMSERDPAPDQVDLSQPGMKVSLGELEQDADGQRRSVLLIDESVQINAFDAAGAPVIVGDQVTFGQVEHTVGPLGPNAMPANLPAFNAYNLCFSFELLEASAQGATRIEFNPPLIHYVDNFQQLEPGFEIATGSYDPVLARWEAEDNSLVVRILQEQGGLAVLDVGSGQPATPAQLEALGVTPAELARLAELYEPGGELVRCRVPHFSYWDFNPAPVPPNDAITPRCIPDDHRRCGCPCDEEEVVTEQVHVESLSLPGVPDDLTYASDRTPGFEAANEVKLTLTPPTLPASVQSVKVEIQTAGNLHRQTFTPAPNLKFTYRNPGEDAYGRRLDRPTVATFRVGYEYPAFIALSDRPRSFGVPGAFVASSRRTRGTVMVWSPARKVELGALDARGVASLGGLTLASHGTYSPVQQVLHMGDGSVRSVAGISSVLRNTIGGNAGASNAEGTLSDRFSFTFQFLGTDRGAVAFAPDGTIYVADTFAQRIRRVDPLTRAVTTLAGTGAIGFSGDGGPAQDATLLGPVRICVGPDQAVYFVDNDRLGTVGSRVRRIGPDQVITTVAGNGTRTYSGDNLPALSAGLGTVQGLAVDMEGNLYLSDSTQHRIHMVDNQGIIRTIAGTGVAGSSGDGGPARSAQVNRPFGLCVAPDNSILIAENGGNRIRRIRTDGRIETVAGTGLAGYSGDGGPATEARLEQPIDVEVAEGRIVFSCNSPSGNGIRGSALRAVQLDGTVTHLAGNGNVIDVTGSGINVENPWSDEGAAAVASGIGRSWDLSRDQNGRLNFTASYVASASPQVSGVFHLEAPLPGWGTDDQLIAAEDGLTLYRFTATGRHLETLNALTGAVLQRFDYDPQGRLTTMTDFDGNTTTIERGPDGQPRAIVGPFGQRTTLTVNADGYVTRATSPGGRVTELTPGPGGLLEAVKDPNGNVRTMTYNDKGRLIRTSDPAGGFVTSTRTDFEQGDFEVRQTTSLGRTATSHVENLPEGGRRLTQTAPDGTQTTIEVEPDGTRTVTGPDGTVSVTRLTSDLRFGMQAAYVASASVTTGGLTANTTSNRSVILSNPANPLSVSFLNEETFVNGRRYFRGWRGSDRTLTEFSPTSRQVISTYSVDGKLLTTTVPLLATVTRSYDAQGRLIRVTEGSGTTARNTDYGYDANSYLETVTDAMSRTVRFTRDVDGRVMSTTLPDGRVVSATYDANSNLLTLTPPGRPAHSFTYDSRDLTEQYTPPAANPGGPTGYAWNADMQPTVTTRPDGDVITSGYDLAGRLQTLTIPRGSFGYGYDSGTGKLSSVSGPGGFSRAYGYQGALLSSLSSGGPVSGSAAWTYDNNFRTTARTVNGANPLSFGYDADGLVTAVGSMALTRNFFNGLLTGTTLGSVTDSLTYSTFGEVSSYVARLSGSPIYSESYVRDNLGRITQRTEVLQGVTTVWGYGYDLSGRLVTVTRNGAAFESYTYDQNDNRLTKTTAAGTTTYAHDDQDRLLSAVGPEGAESWVYDGHGDLLSHNGSAGQTSFDYETGGQLLSVTKPGGDVVSYEMDAGNKRAVKRVNGVVQRQWVYAGGLLPVAELDASGNLVAVFNGGFMVKNGTTYRLLRDHLGSVRLVVDAGTGTVVQRLSYDAWGNVLEDTNPGFQPFGYAGGLYDPDTGLMRFGARDYDSEIGRWTAKDPIRFDGGTNLLAYAFGDPVNLVDSDGRNPWVAGGLIAGGIGLAIYIDTFSEPTREAQELRELGQLTRPQEDAYRHCLASCVAAAHYGDAAARGLAWLNSGNGPGEAEDDYNDQFGRSLCSQMEDPGIPQCRAQCEAAAKFGLLRTYSE